MDIHTYTHAYIHIYRNMCIRKKVNTDTESCVRYSAYAFGCKPDGSRTQMQIEIERKCAREGRKFNRAPTKGVYM